MTYSQMKMLINFIKLCITVATGKSGFLENELVKKSEAWLLMSCGYERKF